MSELTDEMRADGWIEHDGGPCPVDLESRPAILWKDGVITIAGHCAAREWTELEPDSWQHLGHERHHIIAYKPEPPA